MTLYKGNKKIQDVGTYGVYHGSTPIGEIYKGSELVYQWQPYNPDEILIKSQGEITRTMTLRKGVYYIEVTGGGGRSSLTTPDFPSSWFTSGGGSGASVYGEFLLKQTSSITVYGGPERGDSYFDIGDTRIITATAGGSTINHADGGTGTIASTNLITNISLVAHNGNAGVTKIYGGGLWGESVSPNGWGEGGKPNGVNLVVGGAGGIVLQYKRLRP